MVRAALLVALGGVLASTTASPPGVTGMTAVAATTAATEAAAAEVAASSGATPISPEEAEFNRQLVQDIVDYSSDPEERDAAKEALATGDPVVILAFLDGGQQAARKAAADRKAAQAVANRAQLQQWAATGTPTLKANAAELLANGTDEQIANFVTSGYAAAEAADAQAVTDAAADRDRILSRVKTAVATGGPEVRTAGQAALDSEDPEVIAEFYYHGFAAALQRDADAKAAIEAALTARNKAIDDLIDMAGRETRAATARTRILKASLQAVTELGATATDMHLANDAAKKAEQIFHVDQSRRPTGVKGSAAQLAQQTREAKESFDSASYHAGQVAGANATGITSAKVLTETGLTRGIDWARVITAMDGAAQAAVKAAETAWHAAQAVEAASAALDANANAQAHADNAAAWRQAAEDQAKQAHELEIAAADQAKAAADAAARGHDARVRADQAADSAQTHAANAAAALVRARTQRAIAAKAAARAVVQKALAHQAGVRAVNQQDAAAAAAKAAAEAFGTEVTKAGEFQKLAQASVDAGTKANEAVAAYDAKKAAEAANDAANAANSGKPLDKEVADQARAVHAETEKARAAADAAKAEAATAQNAANAAGVEARKAAAAAAAAKAAADAAKVEANQAQADADQAHQAADQANAEATAANTDAQTAAQLATVATETASQAHVSAMNTRAEADAAAHDATTAGIQATIAGRAALTARESAAGIADPAARAFAIADALGATDSDAALAATIAAEAVVIGTEQVNAARQHADLATQAATDAKAAADRAAAQVAPAFQAAAAASASAANATRSAEAAYRSAQAAAAEADAARAAEHRAATAADNAYTSSAAANDLATAAVNDAAVAQQAYRTASNDAGTAGKAASNAAGFVTAVNAIEEKAVFIATQVANAEYNMQLFARSLEGLGAQVDAAAKERAKQQAAEALAKKNQWVQDVHKWIDDHIGSHLGPTGKVVDGIVTELFDMAVGIWNANLCLNPTIHEQFGNSVMSQSEACGAILDGFKSIIENPGQLIHLDEWKTDPYKAAGMCAVDIGMFFIPGGAGIKAANFIRTFDLATAKTAVGALAAAAGEVGAAQLAKAMLGLGTMNTVKIVLESGASALSRALEEAGVSSLAKAIAVAGSEAVAKVLSEATGLDIKAAITKLTDKFSTKIDNIGDDLADVDKLADDFDGPSCKTGTAHSFAADTPVLMSDGTTKPIGVIRVGDQVIATDPATGATAAKPVTYLHRNRDTDLVDITVQTGEGAIQVLHTTAHHPFYNATTAQWTDAANLTPGTTLYTGHSIYQAKVIAIKAWTSLADMHDLTIADTHTYYVVAGTTPVLVHNCLDDLLPGSGPRSGVLEVSDRVKSVAAVKNFGAKEWRDFVWDPETGRFATGADQGVMGHDGLRAAIGASEDTVIGGNIKRGADGQLMTNEWSGHYGGRRWNDETRAQFISFMKGYGIEVQHIPWG